MEARGLLLLLRTCIILYCVSRSHNLFQYYPAFHTCVFVLEVISSFHSPYLQCMRAFVFSLWLITIIHLTLILLTWRMWWVPNNASKWQMGFNSAFKELKCPLTLILLTWRIWWAPNNASRWQMGFNSAFEGLKCPITRILLTWRIWWVPNNASRWQMGFNSAFKGLKCSLTLILLTWRTWWANKNASRWHMGFNAAFKELKMSFNPCLANVENMVSS